LFATLVLFTIIPPYHSAAATGQTFTINSVSQCTSTSDYTTDTSNGCTINNLNLQPGDTLNIGFQSVAVNLGTDGVNAGTINISSLSLMSTNGHTLTNNGAINISGGVFVSAWDNFLHPGNLINNGQIQVTSGGQLQTDGGGLTDNGQITIDGSHSSGLFEDVPFGVSGAATDVISNGGTITSAGEIQVYALSINQGGTLSTTNVVNAQNTISNSGTFTTTNQIFADTFNNNGHLTLTGSSLIDARFFNNYNGGLVDNSSPQFNIGSGNSNEASGTFVNNGGGTINNHGAMNMFGGINNSGLLKNYGSFTVDSSEQSIYNPGTIIAECGSAPISDIINGVQQIFPNGITNGCVPPNLSISSPTNNANLNANTLTVSGTASAAFPITTITGSIDNGQAIIASGTTSWSFSTGHLADGTHIIMVTATDNNGNTVTKSVSVTIDTDLPTLTVPSPITAQATGPHGAVVSYTSTGNDNPDGPITPVCTPSSGSTFALGSTTINCAVTDKAGNTATASFQVLVQDTMPPTIKLPGTITQEATGPSGAPVTFSATATDIVDGTDPVTCTPSSGSTFALGSTTINCSSTDAHGNTATGSFQVSVRDTTAPTITVTNVNAKATGPSGAPVTFSATATDIVDGTDPV
ncbi:MAG: HYR domain-containing protein, partial [Thaumarchaeota archaeon]|nr:HYR domain-containing protein [Nitrososphaerota archaeon]